MDVSQVSCQEKDVKQKTPMFIDLNLIEKNLTILEYINYKIKDFDTTIENLKKELEKNLVEYKT